MNKFFVMAFLPGTEYTLRVVCNLKGQVRSFMTWKLAYDWCCKNLAPDWEWVIVPMLTIDIHEVGDV